MPEERKNIDKLEEAKKEDEESVKKSPNWIKWVIIVVGVVVTSLGAFSLTKFVLLPKYQQYRIEKRISKSEKQSNVKPEMGLIHIIDDLTINTFGSSGRRFAVLGYAIESRDKKVIEEVKSREPQLRDEFIKYLRLHTAEQILDLTFQEKSRKYLIGVINERLNSGKIDSLYYVKLILQ